MIEMKVSKINFLGRLGENEAHIAKFLVGDTAKKFPGCLFSVVNKRPNDSQAYPVPSGNFHIEGNFLYWVLKSGDMAQEGKGECEIIATLDGKIVKSEIYQTEIGRALDGSGTPPQPWEGWIKQVTEDAERAESAADRAEAATVHNPIIIDDVWHVWDQAHSEYVTTGVHAQGETGATPDISIGTVTTGAAGSSASASITGTAENPVLNMTIPRGDKGEKGDSVLKGTLISGDDYMIESEVAE